MKVYKFGGASVKDAKNIKNISNILQIYGNNNNILIVISAIDKTTNALEEVVKKYFLKKNIDYDLNKIKEKHFNINNDLFPNGHNIYYYINNLFFNIKQFFKENKSTNYNFVYDQIVSFGELISTKIISEYFNLIGIKNIWIDVRKYIITDSSYGEAKINWKKTFKYITILNSKKNILYITQGFIGGSDSNYTTTLGREGSDYTASIFSYCLNAESQTIWKDVPGILNADPRYFTNVSLLNKISYEEAIKLAYYGATVIHPKTLEPLLKKDIPLYIRSFINHEKTGTLVSNFKIKPSLPCYIVKNNQILLTFFKKKYYSFFSEQDISNILKYIAKYFLKIGLLHNSVVDLNICINDTYYINDIIKKLSLKYKIQILEKVSLYTVYHYNNNCIEEFIKNKIIILSKITLETAQYIIKD
ncbi:MAG: aspartate kinase [Candidatus Bostrichicola ureolyticus]|nr:MAG: aspartate kinase [Candidatus Bostrichicola ureolyticus]